MVLCNVLTCAITYCWHLTLMFINTVNHESSIWGYHKHRSHNDRTRHTPNCTPIRLPSCPWCTFSSLCQPMALFEWIHWLYRQVQFSQSSQVIFTHHMDCFPPPVVWIGCLILGWAKKKRKFSGTSLAAQHKVLVTIEKKYCWCNDNKQR